MRSGFRIWWGEVKSTLRYNVNDNNDGGDDDGDDGGDDDDVDLEKNLISAGGKPVASGSVGADVGSVGMAALILTATGTAQVVLT